MDSSTRQADAALTQAEKERARKYLADMHERFTRAIENLSREQWTFKPAPDCWSVGEIAEHVALVESRILQRLTEQLAGSPAPPEDRNVQELDELAVKSGADRSKKFQAPAIAAPTGTLAARDVLKRLAESGAKFEAFLEAPADHRRHAMPHPVIGPLDGYQWVLLVAAHSERHAQQIAEVKANAAFPPN